MAAHASQFEHVCIFTEVPSGHVYPKVTLGQAARDFKAALSATGVSVYNLEVFSLTPEVDIADYRRGLELGAELGGKRATSIAFDTDGRRLIDNFSRFCELCAQFGIKAGLEFMVFAEVKTLTHAVNTVQRAAHSNGAVVVDSLHLIRTGSSPADLSVLDPSLIGYIQLCDGPLAMPAESQFDEAIGDRLAPGEGEFPLSQFLQAVPRACPISLEVPMNRRRNRGESAVERARVLQAAARKTLRVAKRDWDG